MLDNHILSQEEITAELAFLNTLYEEAVKMGYTPGSEITNLLVNPKFEEDFKTGWEGTMGSGHTTYTLSDGSYTGAESWSSTPFDMHQTVSGLKNGLYLLEMTAAARPSSEIDTRSKNYTASIYANGNVNYIMTAEEAYIPVGEAVDGETANITGEVADYELKDEEENLIGYMPHGQLSMAIAAKAGRAKNYIVANVTDGVSYGISSYPNNSLRWEKTRTINVGIDFNAFHNRFGLSLDYYRKSSSDLLASDALDPTSGATSIIKNVGEILNRGYEISIQGTPVLTRDFRWDVTYNVSFNHSEVKEYNVDRNYSTSWAWTTPIHAEGYPMYGLFGYKFAGLNEKGETMIYKPDGSAALASTATVDDVVYQGTTVPKTDMSLTNHFSYKNWDLSFMFIAKLGHVFRKDAFHGSNYTSRYFSQRWQKAGDEANTIYPVFKSWNMDMFYFPFCDVNIADADYAKLRDLTLSYTFSKNLINRIWVSEDDKKNISTIQQSGVRVYAQMLPDNMREEIPPL